MDGLADKSRANTRKRVVDVALKHEVRKLQENPELGAFRHPCRIEHHQIPGFKRPFYILSILGNFSRAILASNMCQRQDELSFLLVLSAAIRQHGSPDILVSDSGKIFTSKQARFIYEKLGIQKEETHKKQA